MPQTRKGTYAGHREHVTQLRRTAEARQALEERHPAVAGDRRPMTAHQSACETTPLRKGDAAETQQAAPGHSHGHHHGHHDGHQNGHGHSQAPGHTPAVSK